jgi:hypothetical protein
MVEREAADLGPIAAEGAVRLVGGALEDLGLLCVGLGLGDRAVRDLRCELARAVGDERIDDDLERDVMGLGHLGDRGKLRSVRALWPL